jgi:prepilin-type N-terminal cleavage/methylation domain-containing protein
MYFLEFGSTQSAAGEYVRTYFAGVNATERQVVMDSPSIDRVTSRKDAKGGHRPDGFSLLEMMLVVTLILIVVSIATPSYKTCPSADGCGCARPFCAIISTPCAS